MTRLTTPLCCAAVIGVNATFICLSYVVVPASADEPPKADQSQPKSTEAWQKLAPYFTPPAGLEASSKYRSVLKFSDGHEVKTVTDWRKRRQEIRAQWQALLGPWPELIAKPRIEQLDATERDGFRQQHVRVEIGPGQTGEGYILIPPGQGPFPAVFVPFYDPETSVGSKDKNKLQDFAYQLTKRGFVTLSIGSPGGDAYHPVIGEARCQPLSYLGYVANNCHNALASLPEVDAARIGIVGHSYGGKWSLFGSCLSDKFACAAWSDPGIVFDEVKANVNYWEPWYLGLDPMVTRKRGVISEDSPRTGAYKRLVEEGHDLHELHALMAPRPFLVSGGSEDKPERWGVLLQTVAVNRLLGHENRVGMTNRPAHAPTPESNEIIYAFFEHFLKPAAK